MAEILKRRRLVNPGRRRRRKLSAKQIKFFGTKAQRAALKGSRKRKRRNYGTRIGRSWSSYKGKRRRSNPKRKKLSSRRFASMARQFGKLTTFRRKRRKSSNKRRRKNIGEILTVHVNPGRRKGMAKARRRRKPRVVHHRRRRVNVYRRHRRRSNPVYAAPRRRRRRYSVSHRQRRNYGRRRRNPGMLSGIGSGVFGKAAGVVGGYALTRTISSMLPAQFTQGILGYFGIGVVAYAQGKLVGKVLKSPGVGNDMLVGGITYLVGKVLSDYFPSFGVGLSGMGLIAPSSFYTPQVPLAGMMGNFVVPSAIPVGSSGMHGLGGRLSTRRTGRLQ